MKINVTVEQFEKLEACAEGITWLKSQKDTGLVPLVKSAIAGGINTIRFANWGIVRLMDKPQRIRYAVFAARQVLGIFEAKYPKDKRPRLAIEAAETYLKDPTENNRQKVRCAAAAAAYDAYDAAAYAAADSAAYAAYDAYDAAAYAAADSAAYAAYAANAAAYAADAAADAASYASYAADSAAVSLRLMAKILRYGVKLLAEGRAS